MHPSGAAAPSPPANTVQPEMSGSGENSKPLTGFLWIVVLAAAASASGLFGRFVGDDFIFLEQFRSGAPVLAWPSALPRELYRPATLVSLYVDWRLFHSAAVGYHLTNTLLHIASAILLWRILLKVTQSSLVSFWAACFFATAASHVEAVFWVAARADLVTSAFTLSAILCVFRWTKERRALDVVGTCLCVLVALAAKESTAPLPALLLAIVFADRQFRRRPRSAAPITVAILLATSTYIVIRILAASDEAVTYPNIDWGVRHALLNMPRFLLRTLVPGSFQLRFLYSGVVLSILVIVLLSSAAAGWRRCGRPLALFGAAWLAFLVPVLPLSISTVSSESDRLVYLPGAFGIAAMAILALSCGRGTVVRWLCIAVCALNLAFTIKIGTRWTSSGAHVRTVALRLADFIQHQSSTNQIVFVASMADSIEGVPAFRNGFAPSIRWYSPTADTRSLWPIAAVRLRRDLAGPAITRSGDDTIVIDTTSTPPIRPIASGPFYRSALLTNDRWELTFLDTVQRGVLVSVADARLEVIETISSPGIPFGVVDTQDEAASCEAGTLRIAGWALGHGNLEVFGDYGNADLTLDRRRDGIFGDVGGAIDIERAFPMFTQAATARWDLRIPCVNASNRTAVIRITARDANRHETVLGVRRFAAVEFR